MEKEKKLKNTESYKAKTNLTIQYFRLNAKQY